MLIGSCNHEWSLHPAVLPFTTVTTTMPIMRAIYTGCLRDEEVA